MRRPDPSEKPGWRTLWVPWPQPGAGRAERLGFVRTLQVRMLATSVPLIAFVIVEALSGHMSTFLWIVLVLAVGFPLANWLSPTVKIRREERRPTD